MERATEHEWLKWFYINADFGPAHEDVIMILQQAFKVETKKQLPVGYDLKESTEEQVLG